MTEMRMVSWLNQKRSRPKSLQNQLSITKDSGGKKSWKFQRMPHIILNYIICKKKNKMYCDKRAYREMAKYDWRSHQERSMDLTKDDYWISINEREMLKKEKK